MAIKVPNYLYTVNADGTIAFAEQLTDRDFIESHASEMNIDITNENDYNKYSKQNEINKFIYNKFDEYVIQNDIPNLNVLSSSYASTASYVNGLDYKLQSIESSSVITLKEQEFSTSGIAKVYTFYQGDKEINGVSKINIERDKYTTSGELITDDNGVLYLKLMFDDNTEPIKIPVDKLVEIYKGYNTDTISIEIDDINYIIANVREESITNKHISPNAKISLSKIDLSDLHITGSSNLTSTEQGKIDLSFNNIDITSSSIAIQGLSMSDNPIFNEITSSKFVTKNGTISNLVTGDGSLINIEDMISSSNTIQTEFNTINTKIMQITDTINKLSNFVYSLHYKPTFTITPDIILQSNNTELSNATLTASLMLDDIQQMDFDVDMQTDSDITITPETINGISRTFTAQFNTNIYNEKYIHNITAIISNKDLNYITHITKTITLVHPIYYGYSSIIVNSQDTASELFNNANIHTYNVPTLTAQNIKFTINIPNDNYFYIMVPQYLIQPTQIGVNGFDKDFDTLDNCGIYPITFMSPDDTSIVQATTNYIFYKTQSIQMEGNITYYVI